MSPWGIFLSVSGVVLAISAFVGGVYTLIKHARDIKNWFKNFFRTHGVRGEVHRLEATISELSENIEALQSVAKTNTARLLNVSNELDANTRLTLKLELKSLFRNHPEEILVIEKTWQKYHDLGGDSYIDDMYEVWKKKYVDPKLEAKFKKEND